MINRMEIRPTATLTYEDAPDIWTPAGWHVRVAWETDPPVDRTDGSGWLITSESVARRLVRAVNAGRVFTDVRIALDVNERTYVAARSLVMARHANADLRRLGY
jgi:hypothetical protein